MREETKLFLKDLTLVLNSNSFDLLLLNVKTGDRVEDEMLIKELSERYQGDKVNLYSNSASATLADVVNQGHDKFKEKNEVLVLYATNEAGFSQIEYCAVKGHANINVLPKAIIEMAKVKTFNSEMYDDAEVL